MIKILSFHSKKRHGHDLCNFSSQYNSWMSFSGEKTKKIYGAVFGVALHLKYFFSLMKLNCNIFWWLREILMKQFCEFNADKLSFETSTVLHILIPFV